MFQFDPPTCGFTLQTNPLPDQRNLLLHAAIVRDNDKPCRLVGLQYGIIPKDGLCGGGVSLSRMEVLVLVVNRYL